MDVWQILAVVGILVGIGVIITLIGVLFGGYLVFKGARSVPGEKFLGGVPKGQVFSIPDAGDDFQDRSEKNILEKTERFLAKLGGK